MPIRASGGRARSQRGKGDHGAVRGLEHCKIQRHVSRLFRLYHAAARGRSPNEASPARFGKSEMVDGESKAHLHTHARSAKRGYERSKRGRAAFIASTFELAAAFRARGKLPSDQDFHLWSEQAGLRSISKDNRARWLLLVGTSKRLAVSSWITRTGGHGVGARLIWWVGRFRSLRHQWPVRQRQSGCKLPKKPFASLHLIIVTLPKRRVRCTIQIDHARA